MTTLLPLVAAVLALVAAFVPDPKEDKDAKPADWALLGTLVVVGVACIATSFFRAGLNTPQWYASFGFLGGAISAWLAARFRGGWALAIALAATGAGFAGWVVAGSKLPVQLGLIVGGAAGAFLAVAFGSRSAAGLYTIAVASAVSLDVLTSATATYPLGTLLTTLAAAATLLPRLIKANVATSIALGFVVLALGAFVIGQRVMGIQNVWLLYLGGLVFALLAFWFLPDQYESPVPTLLAVIMVIGLATLAFALQRGQGMALALLGAVSGLALLAHPRGLLAVAPLAALVLYRVFRESHTSAARALDIGQHYGLIGIALGITLPLIALEWWRARTASDPARTQIGGVLWAGLLIASPLAVGIVMASKGVVGLVAGVGFAGVVELLRGGRSLQALSLGLGIAASATLLYGWSGDLAQLSRDEKIAALVPLGIALGVAVLVLAVVSPKPARLELEVDS